MKKLLIYKENGEFVIERVNQFNHATKRYFSSDEGLLEGLQAYQDVMEEYELSVADDLWAKVIKYLSRPEFRGRGQLSVLFTLHKKMYDVSWNGARGDSQKLEKEFLQLAEQIGLHQEIVNTMMDQLYIPPYKEHDLPDYLKANSRGGRREGAGRPAVGTTRRVALTLPDEVWDRIDYEKEHQGISQAQAIRDTLIHFYFPSGLK